MPPAPIEHLRIPETTDGSLSGSRVAIDRRLLARLIGDTELVVWIEPGTGSNLTSDWWVAEIQTLGSKACAFGFEATMVELAATARADAMAAADGETSSRAELSLALQILLANERENLDALLDAGSRYRDSPDASVRHLPVASQPAPSALYELLGAQ